MEKVAERLRVRQKNICTKQKNHFLCGGYLLYFICSVLTVRKNRLVRRRRRRRRHHRVFLPFTVSFLSFSLSLSLSMQMRVKVCVSVFVYTVYVVGHPIKYMYVRSLGSLWCSVLSNGMFRFYDREAIFIVLLLYVNFKQAHTTSS